MRMILVQHLENGEWLACYREDLSTSPYIADALFYTQGEAEAYITAMCGLIHCGGDPRNFRCVPVDHTGETYTLVPPAPLPLFEQDVRRA